MKLLFSRYHWVSYGLFILLTSCVSMGRISVQVSVPPQRIISSDIQSIALMNRSMTSSFTNLDQDSLENLFIKNKLVLNELMLDSVAADTTLKVIGNSMFESGRFDVVIPVKRNLPNNNLSYLDKSASLSLPEVSQICNEFKVDALLALENFYENVTTSYQIGYNRTSDYGSTKEYTIFVQIAYHSNWKLYQPGEKLKVAKFEVNDTIFWERSGETLQETYEQLPTIKEALIGGAIENAQNLAAYISPGWQQQGRSYFITNNVDIDKAVTWLNKNNWKEAENVWKKFSTVSSPGLRSQVEFNLALASEMNGNLKEAIQWAKKSLHTKYSKAAEDYIRLLNDRLNSN